MRFCTFEREGQTHFGLEVDRERLLDLAGAWRILSASGRIAADPTLERAVDLKGWLAAGPQSFRMADRIRQLVSSAEDSCREALHPLEQVRLLAPIPRPGKIIAVGLNYRDHAREQNAPIPKEPLIFAKFPSAVIGPGQAIRLPSISRRVDVEAELCLVMGKTGRAFSVEEAAQAIAGYTIGNDVSARDLQFSDRQWVRGKSCDTFAPTGPFLVSGDEVGDPHDLKIELRLCGRLQQSSTTRNLIFNCFELVSFISQAITLETGDLIFTGTPAGVGVFRDPPVFLKDGDRVEVRIEKLGVLANPVELE